MLVFQGLGHQTLLCTQGEGVGEVLGWGLQNSVIVHPSIWGGHEASGWLCLRLASQGTLITPLGG